MASVPGTREFLRRVYTDFSNKNVPFMAAGLAYSAFVSLTPLLVLTFLAFAAVGGGLEARVLAFAGQWLPGPVAGAVRQTFREQSGVGSASVLGFLVLSWGALKIFRGLDTAFSEIYETVDDNSFVNKVTDGLVVSFALVVAAVGTVGTSVAFAAYADALPFGGYATPLVLLGGLVVAFLPMYYVFPDCDLSVRDVVPGALFAALSWVAFQDLFRVYLAVSDPGSGSFAGSVLVVVVYLYFSALVLLVGAVINAALGGHSTGRAGGVGEGADSPRTRRQASLDREQIDAYLRVLNERLTTTYDADVSDDRELIPRPDGDVRLVEYTTDVEGEGRRWTVELSWATDPDPAPQRSRDAHVGPADD